MSCGGVQYVPGQFYGNGEDNIRGICSGNGVCVSDQCICNPGFTSLTDFFGQTNSDCATSVLGMQIEYGLLLFITLVALLGSIKGLKKRYVDYENAKEQAARKGRRYNITNNRAALSMILWHGIGTPCIVATCLLRILLPEERVGVTVPLTVLFLITKTAFYICSLLYQPYLFKILMKSENINRDKYNRLVRFVNLAAIVGCLLSVVAGFIPFASIGNKSVAPAVYNAYYYLSAFGLLYNAGMALAIYRKAETLLSQSYSQTKDGKVLKMKKKMKGFQMGVVKNAGVFGIVYIIMALWPFFWNLHDYFHGVTWIIFIKVAVDIANGTLEKGDGKTSSGSVTSPKNPLVPNASGTQTIPATEEAVSYSESV